MEILKLKQPFFVGQILEDEVAGGLFPLIIPFFPWSQKKIPRPFRNLPTETGFRNLPIKTVNRSAQDSLQKAGRVFPPLTSKEPTNHVHPTPGSQAASPSQESQRGRGLRSPSRAWRRKPSAWQESVALFPTGSFPPNAVTAEGGDATYFRRGGGGLGSECVCVRERARPTGGFAGKREREKKGESLPPPPLS